MPDGDRTPDAVAAILAALPLAIAATLAERMPSAVRLGVRDRAIREARERYFGCLPRTAAARALATALAAPGDLPDAAAALQQIIALNGGRRLAWRQLADLIDSTRPIGWRGH